MPPIFQDWFRFSGNLHRYKTCWSVNDHLYIPTFWIEKYSCFSIRGSTIYLWNSKKELYGPFLWMGFNCVQARATQRRQFTFYHYFLLCTKSLNMYHSKTQLQKRLNIFLNILLKSTTSNILGHNLQGKLQTYTFI